MLVAIGSTNPVKVNAVRNVIGQVYPEAKFVSQEVRSGISAQPIGNAETRRGALNRARAVLEQTGADWGAGLEGGIIQTELGTMTTAWCVLVDREGRTGVGGAANVLLPEELAKEILGGTEMGPAMEEFSGIENVKKKMGAIGVLTRGLIDRQQAYECLVKFALARFLWEEPTPPDLPR